MATVEEIRQALTDQSVLFNQELNRRDTLLSQMQAQMAAMAAAQVTNGTTPTPPLPQPVHMMQGVVDLRLLGKPGHFDGQHWRDWSVVFRSYASAVSQRLGQLMLVAEQSDIAVLTAAMVQPDSDWSIQLYHMLVMLCKEAALTRVVNAGHGNGLELADLGELP